MVAVEYSERQRQRVEEFRSQAHTDGRDPTQTTTLRKRWAGEAYRRFRALQGIIRENIIEQDVLGLKERDGVGIQSDRLNSDRLTGQQEPFFPEGARLPVRRFDYPTDPRKVDEFMNWVDEMVTQGILEAAENPAFGAVGGTTSAWQNLYIRQAYSKGLVHAEHAAKRIGVQVPDQTLEMLFRNPRHAEQVGLLYTRAFGELDGITDAMAQQMRRTLAEGLSQGWGAEQMARELNDRVNAIGITRARTLSRTETVRAVNEAALTRYEGLGIERVGALVEFVTAGDLRVCPICESLEGATMPIAEARGLIPVHPNCRCMWLPVPQGDQSRIRGVGPDLPVVPPTGTPISGPRRPPSEEPRVGPTRLPEDISTEDLIASYRPDRRNDLDQFTRSDWPHEWIERINNADDFDGFTLNADLTPWENERGYVVGIASSNFSRTGGISREAITEFWDNHFEVLERFPVATKIGTYVNPDEDLISIDLSVVLTDLDEAKDLGAQLNQISIWNADAGRLISTGGTGETVVESIDDIMGVLETVQSKIPPDTSRIIIASSPTTGEVTAYAPINDDFLDKTADRWAAAIDDGLVPDEANVLRARASESMADSEDIAGGINKYNMRILFDDPDDDTPSTFLKYYDDNSYGTARDAVAANRLIRRLDGRAPKSAFIDDVDSTLIGLDRGGKTGSQLALEGIRDVTTLENAYDRVDPNDLAEQFARGTLVGNNDMHSRNLLVDADDNVWLVDNDIAVAFTHPMARDGEIDGRTADRLWGHLGNMGLDPEERVQYMEKYLDDLEEFSHRIFENRELVEDLEDITPMSNVGQTATTIIEDGPPRISARQLERWVDRDDPLFDEMEERLGEGRI